MLLSLPPNQSMPVKPDAKTSTNAMLSCSPVRAVYSGFRMPISLLYPADNCFMLAYDGTEAGTSGGSGFDALSFR